MAEEVGYTQFFSYIVRYQSKADASEHIIFYGARDLKDIALSNLLPTYIEKKIQPNRGRQKSRFLLEGKEKNYKE